MIIKTIYKLILYVHKCITEYLREEYDNTEIWRENAYELFEVDESLFIHSN